MSMRNIVVMIAGLFFIVAVLGGACVAVSHVSGGDVVEPVEQVEPVDVPVVSVDDIVESAETEPVWWVTSGGRDEPDVDEADEEEIQGIWIKGHFIPFSEIM